MMMLFVLQSSRSRRSIVTGFEIADSPAHFP